MTKTTETLAPGTNPPPAGRPARPADLLGKADKPVRKVYEYLALDGSDAPAGAHDLRYLGEVHADTNDEACWLWAEGPGKDKAMSANPPKLTSLSTGRNGLPEPAPYALEPAVRRKRA